MKTERRRITIIPFWHEKPDTHEFAVAVVEMAREQLTEKKQQHDTLPQTEVGNA